MSAAGTQAAILAAEGKFDGVEAVPPTPLSGELVKVDYAGRTDDATFFAECEAALDANGVACLLHAITESEADDITEEMQPYIDATPNHQIFPSDGNTKRVGALAARSKASHKALLHPGVLGICDRVLSNQTISGREVQRFSQPRGESEYSYRLSLTQIIEVGPDSPKQVIHRGNGLWGHSFDQNVDPQVECLWALDDFTEENGATHVLPGSHKWQAQIFDEDDAARAEKEVALQRAESIQATMPKGSVLIWTGWTAHGAGANRTGKRRMSMNIDYVLSFLQCEENQFLACPPHIARDCPEDLQALMGYQLGYQVRDAMRCAQALGTGGK